MNPGPTPARQFSLLLIFLRMRVRMVLNMTMANRLFKSKKKPEKTSRKATAARFAPNFLLILWITLSMIFTGLPFFHHQLDQIRHQFNPEVQPEEWLRMISVFFMIQFLMALSMTLGMGKFTKTEWDLEWLLTLPVSKHVLMANRIIERALLNPIYLGLLYLPLIVLFQSAHYSTFLSISLSFLATLPLLFFVSALQTLVDTGLRMKLKPARLKNIQAAASLLSIALLLLPQMAVSRFPPHLTWFNTIFGSFTLRLPFGLIPRMIFSTFPQPGDLLFLMLETIFLVGGPYLLLLHQLRNGVVTGSGELSTRKNNVRLVVPKIPADFLSPFLLRELRLLLRDQGYLAQTLLTPIIVLGMQVFIMLQDKQRMVTDPKAIASMAFGIAGRSGTFQRRFLPDI